MRPAGLGVLLALTACVAPAVRADAVEPTADDIAGEVGTQFDLDDIEALLEVDDDLEVDDEDVEPCDDPDSSAVTLLSCMRSGTWTERLHAVEWLPDALGAIGADASADQETLDDAIDLLIRIVHEEPDDWIARALLDALEFEAGPGIDRLFRAALREASINLRALAVQRLGEEADVEAFDDLESLWRSVVPAWLRPHLIAALAGQPTVRESPWRHLNDFIELADDRDPEVRLAAFDALGSLGVDAARPALMHAVRAGTRRDRARALEALALLPVTDETMAEMAQAIRSDDARARGAAIGALGGIGHPDAEPLLFEVLARSSADLELINAAEALEGSKHPDATAVIAGVLIRLNPEEDTWPMRRILMVLHNRDDVTALGSLLRLSPGSWETPGRDLTSLIEYLSRNRSTVKGSTMVSTSCSLGSRAADPESLRARRIAPAPPFETVRCWEAPSVAGASWNEDRLRAGAVVEIDDHFERPEGTWVKVVDRMVSCWVPLDDLAAADTPPPLTDSTRPPRLEFDLPAREADSAAARRLIEAGLMQILEADSHADVVAAALSVDPADPDQVALLEAVSTGSRGALDRAIARFRRACCAPLP